MTVLSMKSFFFSGANSYSFDQKAQMFHFFLSFHGEMIKVLYAMFAVTIEDLEMQIRNLNPPLSKNAIWFEQLPQKLETCKQTTSALYYQ